MAAVDDRGPPSHGRLVALRYGAAGARGEAVAGFPGLFQLALPALRNAIALGVAPPAAQTHALFALMAQLEDTNVLYRGGRGALEWLHGAAREFLEAAACSSTAGRNAPRPFTALLRAAPVAGRLRGPPRRRMVRASAADRCMTLAILCPGQGHQHAAMLDLAARDADARNVLGEARQSSASTCGNGSRARPPVRQSHRAADDLRGAAGHMARAARGIAPAAAVAGYSVGELASHACAGAFDARALCRVANVRAQAMDDAGVRQPGAMVAIEGLPRAAIERLCDGHQAWLAIVIDDLRHVVGGARRDTDVVVEAATSRGAQVHRLAVAVASHTPLMAPAVAPFRAALEAVRFTAATSPVLAGVDASTVLDSAAAIDALCAQMTTTVQWGRCLRVAH